VGHSLHKWGIPFISGAGHRNANQNSRWSCQVSFERLIRKEIWTLTIADFDLRFDEHFESHLLWNRLYVYSLHPTPYTLYLTPYTLHPTPYTLNPKPYTLNLNPKPYTLWWIEDVATTLYEERLEEIDMGWPRLVSRLLKIIGLFCRRALQKRWFSAKQNYDIKEPTKRSHPIKDDSIRFRV